MGHRVSMTTNASASIYILNSFKKSKNVVSDFGQAISGNCCHLKNLKDNRQKILPTVEEIAYAKIDSNEKLRFFSHILSPKPYAK